jgi:hypothetical protein
MGRGREDAGSPVARGNPVHDRQLEATRDNPDDVNAWLARAETALSTDERIFCLSQVSRLDPDHPIGKELMHRTLWSELQRDSFLSYLEETEDIYYVRNKYFTSLAISKDRLDFEEYPPDKLSDIHRARGRLGWAIAGLALSGVGTLLYAPLAIASAVRTLTKSRDPRDRRGAWMVIALCLILLPIAVFLVYLLVIHF